MSEGGAWVGVCRVSQASRRARGRDGTRAATRRRVNYSSGAGGAGRGEQRGRGFWHTGGPDGLQRSRRGEGRGGGKRAREVSGQTTRLTRQRFVGFNQNVRSLTRPQTNRVNHYLGFLCLKNETV